MPRSSRHESSHRAHKHSSKDARERSDSDEEGNSRERRLREEPAVSGLASRVSRDLEPEKRKGSSSSLFSQGKEVPGAGNGDYSGDHGKKRKDRPADSANGQDKWNEKELKGEEFGHLDLEGTAKVKVSAGDSKGKSSRRHESSSERKENSVGKDDSAKRRSEKDYSRRESSIHHKDSKDRERERGSERDREQGSERDRERGSERERESGLHRGRENWLDKERERGLEREKKIQDGRRERSSDASARKQGGRADSLEEECLVKGDVESADWQIQEELRNVEPEKELEKRTQKKRDDFRDKDKWQEDNQECENDVNILLKNDKWQGEGRDGEDKRLSSKEVRMKNVSYKDEKHKDGSYRDKYREGMDRVQRHQDDRGRDDRSSREHTSDRSNSKHYRDERKSLDGHCKRSKHQDSDHDGSPDDRGTKYKDGRGRKRPSDENEEHIDVKLRNSKELCANLDKSAPYSSNADCGGDRDRPENVYPDKVDFGSNRPKSSPSSTVQYSRDQYRHSSKQMEAMAGNSFSEDRSHMASSGDIASTTHERVPEHRSLEKSKMKGERRVDELSIKGVASSKYERSPRSDGPGSPIHLTEKSPSSTTDRRRLNRPVVRRSLDIEEAGQRSSILKDVTSFATSEDKEQEQPKERPVSGDRSQVDMASNYSVPAGLSSFNRTENVSSGFSSHFPPPVRFGVDGPVLGSFDEDRKSANRYKRNIDFNMSRQGNAWKGIQNWPSPVANGFIPFQHLPPPGGFHPVVQQFPPPSLFGIRPSMDMGHTGVPYHMHEAPDRFPSHARPFGWRNPVEDSCPPHLQGWDGSNSIPLEESHIYRRPDWEQSRHLISNRGWEMSVDVWKGQNGNNNMDPPVPKELDYPTHVPPDETWAGQPVHQPHSELARSPAESIEIKQSHETTPVKDTVEIPSRVACEETPEPSKPLKDDNAHFCCAYLSKLDISADLARPELYKQCMTLIGTVDTAWNSFDVPKVYPQGIKNDAKVETRGSNLLSSHFPVIPDAVFQRAVLLYKKQNKEMKRKTCQLFCKAEEEKTTAAAEKVVQVEELASEDVSHGNVNPPSSEDNSVSTDAKCVPAGNLMEQVTDTMSGVVVEGPEACEVLMPECRLNLSRIHHSPESTH